MRRITVTSSVEVGVISQSAPPMSFYIFGSFLIDWPLEKQQFL